jgi:very-short-patch-repair endonuclease
LVRKQHGVITRGQLLDVGLTPKAIEHRVAKRRLHPVRRGVYAVGRRELPRLGELMAAVLSCGPGAVASHESAGEVLGIRPRSAVIELSVPADRRQPGIVVHRRATVDATVYHGIPVTNVVQTLIDLAPRLPVAELEAAINAADKLDLIDPESLRDAVEEFAGQPGVGKLRTVLDRRTFTLTDTDLERIFLPLARRAGLPQPDTQCWVNGFRVDFFWPDLGLVVETDGLTYHRTPAEQATDRVRDQTHTAAGLTTLRFTRGQVRFEPARVSDTLAVVARRLRR